MQPGPRAVNQSPKRGTAPRGCSRRPRPFPTAGRSPGSRAPRRRGQRGRIDGGRLRHAAGARRARALTSDGSHEGARKSVSGTRDDIPRRIAGFEPEVESADASRAKKRLARSAPGPAHRIGIRQDRGLDDLDDAGRDGLAGRQSRFVAHRRYHLHGGPGHRTRHGCRRARPRPVVVTTDLDVHLTTPVKTGPLRIEVEVLRAGETTTVSASRSTTTGSVAPSAAARRRAVRSPSSSIGRSWRSPSGSPSTTATEARLPEGIRQ